MYTLKSITSDIFKTIYSHGKCKWYPCCDKLFLTCTCILKNNYMLIYICILNVNNYYKFLIMLGYSIKSYIESTST